MRIDLNSDLGESFGPWPMGQDAALMDSISSANVACGFHAGDPATMRATLRLARAKRVAVGAHPGFPDLVGFGRREIKASAAEVEDLVLYQVAALAGMAAAEGLRLQHVKAHGALYNMACRDRALADAIARATAAIDRSLILFGLPNSELLRAGEAAGLQVAAEVFADRAYDPDGSLTARTTPGSVIHDTPAVVERAIKMVRDKVVVAVDGSAIALQADTICLHGDTPGAAEHAKAVRRGLEAAGIQIQRLRA
ncbi:MAG TPA: 5-oxoprolinase subunit PxpA [Vicinamibacterales bacterium]|nr:5-oxoprolinase subunit PxpA [Vicinamibacterales bacterium]